MSGNLHALLIGVSHYFPNKLSDGGSYESLDGAVCDIERVESFLTGRLKIAPERIRKLVITASPEAAPTEPQEMWPTYENMVRAFQGLAEAVSQDDEVYIHYSGHGGRTPTRCRTKESKVDECLVPCDIGNSSARYLRDVELSRLLQKIAAKKPRMTVVLDCCHAGGAARGRGGAVRRGRSTVDTTPRPEESLVGSWEDLEAEWQSDKDTNGVKRNMSVQSWMPRSDGYVLFAACRPQESAYEFPFENDEPQGALTYWLLDTLRRSGPGVACKDLQDRLMAKIHTQFWYQTPMLLGNPERAFLGANGGVSHYGINVLSVDRGTGRILLNAGRAQGVTEGARLAIEVKGRAVPFEIVQAGAAESWARLVKVTRDNTMGSMQQGAQAVLLQPGQIELQSAVELVRQDELPAGIDQDAALDRVRSLLARPQDGAFLRLAGRGEAADYQVIVNAGGEYEIRYSKEERVPNVRPLPIDAPDAAEEVVRRLVHLIRYWNVQELENFDDVSPLARKIRLEIVGTQTDYKQGTKPDPRPYDGPAGCVDLEVGEWLFVKLVNRSSHVLNLVVLDLQPDWAIQQAFPGKNDAAYWSFDPGEERMLRLRGSLPDGCDEGSDFLKAIGTLGAPDYRWLEMQAIDQPASNHRGSTKGPLNQLFAALATNAPRKRQLNPSEFASEEWGTAQIEVRVRRR